MMERFLAAAIVFCVVLCAATVNADPKVPSPHVPKGWKFSLPPGDAAAGKTAFRKLECYTCHKTRAGEFPEPRSSGGTGPELVAAYSRLPREFLAEAILNPHKYMSGTLEHYRGVEKVSAEMRDYSSLITVRELLDLVEFLKHLDAEPSATPGS
ncbi:MAG: cytochrome c [Deltaproteobacteria bacterium]|nr:cytochrome c [Deltaproteobacteria bacterium]